MLVCRMEPSGWGGDRAGPHRQLCFSRLSCISRFLLFMRTYMTPSRSLMERVWGGRGAGRRGQDRNSQRALLRFLSSLPSSCPFIGVFKCTSGVGYLRYPLHGVNTQTPPGAEHTQTHTHHHHPLACCALLPFPPLITPLAPAPHH